MAVDGVRGSASLYFRSENNEFVRMGWSGRANDFFRGGDRLRQLQNDLFHGGYYPRAPRYGSEVDGLYGGRTQGAVRRLQEDLTAAGVYAGQATGEFDQATAQALTQLRSLERLPEGLDPAAARRLSRFVSAEQASPAESVATRDTFETPRAAPVQLGEGAPATQAPAPDVGEERIQKMVKLLGGGVNMAELARTGPVTPERFQQAIGDLAGRLEALPDTRGFFSAFGKEQLGFDPAKNSEAEIDAFLRGIRQQLQGQPAQAGQLPITAPPSRPGAPVDADVVTQNVGRLLSNYVDMGALSRQGRANPADFQRELARVAGDLMARPDTREVLARLGRGQLGFDPLKSSEQEIDAFLSVFRRQLMQGTQAPATNLDAGRSDVMLA